VTTPRGASRSYRWLYAVEVVVLAFGLVLIAIGELIRGLFFVVAPALVVWSVWSRTRTPGNKLANWIGPTFGIGVTAAACLAAGINRLTDDAPLAGWTLIAIALFAGGLLSFIAIRARRAD